MCDLVTLLCEPFPSSSVATFFTIKPLYYLLTHNHQIHANQQHLLYFPQKNYLGHAPKHAWTSKTIRQQKTHLNHCHNKRYSSIKVEMVT